VGVVTATRPERTLEAVELILEILEDFREDAPSRDDEVALALEQIVNGYVFAFESASQIVGRRMGDRAQGLADGVARALPGGDPGRDPGTSWRWPGATSARRR
jgi:hypothetical protein